MLTEQEREALNEALLISLSDHAFDTIEAAVLAKLRECVALPSPVGECTVPADSYVLQEGDTVKLIDAYSKAQLLDYGDRRAAAARVQMNEECAALCSNFGGFKDGYECASEIRVMLEAAPKETP